LNFRKIEDAFEIHNHYDVLPCYWAASTTSFDGLPVAAFDKLNSGFKESFLKKV
jgi:hypothetical protein